MMIDEIIWTDKQKISRIDKINNDFPNFVVKIDIAYILNYQGRMKYEEFTYWLKLCGRLTLGVKLYYRD